MNLDLNYTSVGLLKMRNSLDVSECTFHFSGTGDYTGKI